MRKQLLSISLIAIGIMAFLSACTGVEDKATQTAETNKISGAEILEDAKTYAEQQCNFVYQERLLNENPGVKDYDMKMKALKQEKKKAKNFYRKKYNGLTHEWVAFQRAVKAARQDSEYCIKTAKEKIKE